MIEAGRVSVNGERATIGRRVDPHHDSVEIDRVPVPTRPGLVHYLLNKPAGFITTPTDEKGRDTVMSLVPARERVYPVGRLDRETEGLLLLTNDGDLTHRLTHPSFGVPKEYLVQVKGRLAPVAVRQLREGIELDDGVTAPAKVALVAPTTLRIVIHEGRNRQVRRMCEAVGHPVTRLVRTRIGPVSDPRLSPGEWRLLSVEEVRALSAAAGSTQRRRG